MATKRKRSCNYTSQEIAVLLDLVEQHRSAVEEKRCSNVYLARKKEAWEKIRNSYNSFATSGLRTVDQLRILYDNIKQKARRSQAKRNEEWRKTDGGSYPTVSESDKNVLDTSKDQVTMLQNEYESDTTVLEDVSISVDVEPLVTDNEMSPEMFENNEEHNNSLPIKQKAVTPKHPKHSEDKKGTNHKQLYFKTKCQNAYLDRRRIYLEIRLRQKEYSLLIKEHETKMKHMEEEHKLKMKMLQDPLNI